MNSDVPLEDQLETLLQAGNPVIIRLLSDSENSPSKTVLQSWSKSLFLLVDAPNLRFPTPGAPCDVRFVYEGYACAFVSGVLDHGVYCGRDSWRIRWPDKIRLASFRKYVRVKTCLNSSLDCGGVSYDGTIIDISMGGCGFLCAAPPPSSGMPCRLSFQLPSGELIENASATIRSIRENGNEFLVGCEFEEREGEARTSVAFYVENMLNRKKESVSPPIVLLASDTASGRTVSDNMRQMGLEVVTTNTLVDAMFSIQTHKPAALILSHDQEGVSTVDIVRLLKSNPKTKKLMILVYGVPSGQCDAILDAGADDSFGDDPPYGVLAKLFEKTSSGMAHDKQGVA